MIRCPNIQRNKTYLANFCTTHPGSAGAPWASPVETGRGRPRRTPGTRADWSPAGSHPQAPPTGQTWGHMSRCGQQWGHILTLGLMGRGGGSFYSTLRFSVNGGKSVARSATVFAILIRTSFPHNSWNLSFRSDQVTLLPKTFVITLSLQLLRIAMKHSVLHKRINA